MSLQFNNTNATLNNLVDMFFKIAAGHEMIKSFGYGETFDINAQTVENYPLFWVTILPGKEYDGYNSHAFRFIMMDIVDTAQKNELEVMSDTRRVLRDIMLIIRDVYDFEIRYDNQVNPFTEGKTDRVSGWYMECEIDVPQSYGACDAPFNQC